MVKRDRARLCMRPVCEPVFVGDIRQRERLLSAFITVDTAAEIKQLFLEFQAAGVNFHQGLKPCGQETSSSSPPNGNLMLFVGPAG